MRKMIVLGMSLVMTLAISITSFAEGFKRDDRGLRYQYRDGSYAVGGWKLIDGGYYRFDDDGYIFVVADTSSGLLPEGWKQDDRGWMFYQGDGSQLGDGWYLIDGKHYFFEDGYMLADTITPYGLYVGVDGALVEEPIGEYYDLTKGFLKQEYYPDFFAKSSRISAIEEGSDYYQIPVDSIYGESIRITKDCITRGDAGIEYKNPKDYFHALALDSDYEGHLGELIWIKSYDSRGYATNIVWVHSSLE